MGRRRKKSHFLKIASSYFFLRKKKIFFRDKIIKFCDNFCSGIINKNEIYSCAQLEAQELREKQENQSQTTNKVHATAKKQEIEQKIVNKKDNLVLGVNDLLNSNKKSVQPKNLDTKKNNLKSAKPNLAVTVNLPKIEKSEIPAQKEETNKKESIVDQKFKSKKFSAPIENVIKVNNCEIINTRRPRTVTSSFFSAKSEAVPITVEEKPKPSVKNIILVSRDPTLAVGRTAKSQHKKQIVTDPNQPKPHNVTTKLLSPITEGMNKGFLMYSEEEPGLTSE